MKKKINGILILEPLDFDRKVICKLKEICNEVFLGLGDISNYDKIEAIFVRLKFFINNDFTSKFINLRYILSPTTGITHISEEILNDPKIELIKLEKSSSLLKNITSTPELAWGLFLNLVRNINLSFDSVKRGFWERDSFKGYQIKGMKIGIIGYGRIGKQISKYANAFGCDNFIYDIRKISNIKNVKKNVPYLNDIAKFSDAIFLSASYKPNDPLIVDRNFLKKTKKKPYIINISRSMLVDEVALCEALEKKRLRGVATDVIFGEENGYYLNSPLFQRAQNHSDVLITPHLGGCTHSAMKITENIILKSFIKKLSYE